MSKLIIISGPSGVGKGTIINRIIDKYHEEGKDIYFSVSYTTRTPREGETDGVEYTFVSKEKFLDLIHNNGLLEYNKYGDKYYGTPKDVVFGYLDNGYDVIIEMDVNGYQQIKKLGIPHTSIFIAPPSVEELETRLRNRGTEDENSIRRRIKQAMNEIMQLKEYQHVVFNEDGELDKAVDKVYEIISKKYVK